MAEEIKPIIKKSNLAERLTTYIFYASVFIFLVAFNFRDSMTGGWYQQWLPNLNGRSISDIIFVDSLTGFAVTNSLAVNDTAFILKTTNGGNNWTINYSYTQIYYSDFSRVKFINPNTGYAAGMTLLKTTNSGLNWTAIPTPNNIPCSDISLINVDTFYICNTVAFDGGLFITTNGGASWTRLYYAISSNPSRIYMYNARIGFMMTNDNQTLKTTDGGNNWFQVLASEGYTDIHFVDSLVGWKNNITNTQIKKTTNGGLNWYLQTLPPEGGHFYLVRLRHFHCLNKDTIWGVGGEYQLYDYTKRGLIYKTTNGGINWGYQLPDTSLILLQEYQYVDFINKNYGWAYSTLPSGVHTVVGGNDTTIYTNIKEKITDISTQFKLEQNYPNPFNQFTIINVQLKIAKQIKVVVFDITGKKIITIINRKENTGEHSYKVDGGNLSSGVYFYTLFADGTRVDTKKMLLIK